MRERPTQRAFLPSDYGRPPSLRDRLRERGAPRPRTDAEALYLERNDPRRGNTDHVERLKAEVNRRLATDTMLEGEERSGRDVEPPQGKNIERLDRSRSVDDPLCGSERTKMNDDATAVESTAPEAEQVTKATKAKIKKPKAEKKAARRAKKTAKKVAKVIKKIVKSAKKATKAKKAGKYLPRSKRDEIPCCVNYPKKLHKALHVAAKKAGLSFSRFMREIGAKKVGFKLAR